MNPDYAAAEVAEDVRRRGCVDVLWYFKRPTTKQIQQDRQPLAASSAEKYNLASIHLNGELICDP